MEYLDLIEPLTNPREHGGEAADAFHVVIPDMPGFAFSGPTKEPGWTIFRVAAAWVELMRRLGYERYGAHGNDGGSQVSPEMGRIAPEHVIGVHVTQLFSFPSGDPAEFERLSAEDMRRLEFLQNFDRDLAGGTKLMASTPQTAAHALADSPAGQLAWSAQFLGGCSDDFVLTNASIYWLTNTSASANRLYYENAHATPPTEPNGPAPAGHRLRLAVAASARDGDQDATATLVRQAPAHGLDVAELLAVAEAHWPKPRLHRRAWQTSRRWTVARLRRLHRPHRQARVLAGREPQR